MVAGRCLFVLVDFAAPMQWVQKALIQCRGRAVGLAKCRMVYVLRRPVCWPIEPVLCFDSKKTSVLSGLSQFESVKCSALYTTPVLSRSEQRNICWYLLPNRELAVLSGKVGFAWECQEVAAH